METRVSAVEANPIKQIDRIMIHGQIYFQKQKNCHVLSFKLNLHPLNYFNCTLNFVFHQIHFLLQYISCSESHRFIYLIQKVFQHVNLKCRVTKYLNFILFILLHSEIAARCQWLQCFFFILNSVFTCNTISQNTLKLTYSICVKKTS